jgi:hypothetical protein
MLFILEFLFLWMACNCGIRKSWKLAKVGRNERIERKLIEHFENIKK